MAGPYPRLPAPKARVSQKNGVVPKVKYMTFWAAPYVYRFFYDEICIYILTNALFIRFI